jgi:hypothetical protein
MNYIACMLQTELTMEFLCFEILQVASVFDLIISHITDNYLHIWKHFFMVFICYSSPII